MKKFLSSLWWFVKLPFTLFIVLIISIIEVLGYKKCPNCGEYSEDIPLIDSKKREGFFCPHCHKVTYK